MRTAIFIYILIVHWLLDFVFQTTEEAANKSKSFKVLTSHTQTYAAGWGVFLIAHFIFNANFTFDVFTDISWFIVTTFITHTLIDFFTSKLTAKLFAKQDYHNFFVVVGFDQILHYLQLWFTFKLFLNYF